MRNDRVFFVKLLSIALFMMPLLPIGQCSASADPGGPYGWERSTRSSSQPSARGWSHGPASARRTEGRSAIRAPLASRATSSPRNPEREPPVDRLRPNTRDSTRTHVSAAEAYVVKLHSPLRVDLMDVTLGADEGIMLGPKASVMRENGMAAILANLGQAGVVLQPNALAGHVYSASSVILKPRSRLLGGIDALSVTIFSKAVVEGLVNEAPLPTPFQETEFSVEFPEAAQGNVMVSPHETRELLPERYGSVKVSPNATLQLMSGRYYIETLALQPQSRIELLQQTGPTYIFVKQAGIIGAALTFTPDYRGFMLMQTAASPIRVDTPFRGVLLAPGAELKLMSGDEPHRGTFFARSILLDPKASVIYETPNPLVGVISPPEQGLQECADSIRPRDDLSGEERERAYQADIARYCSMVGEDECMIDLITRMYADSFSAASRLAQRVFSPAEYLAITKDRARKQAAVEKNPHWCGKHDSDGDYVPDDFDTCPGTPSLSPTDDRGCLDWTLPPAPTGEEFEEVLNSYYIMVHPACEGAGPLYPLRPLFHKRSHPHGGPFWASLIHTRVANQPQGCPIWYQFDILRPTPSLPEDIRFSFFFQHSEEEEFLLKPALMESQLIPAEAIQFIAYSTDDNSARSALALTPLYIRFYWRVRALNGNGALSPWSEWWTGNTRQSCWSLGFDCSRPRPPEDLP